MKTLIDLLDAATEAHRDTTALSIHTGLRDRAWSYRRLRRATAAGAQYLRADLGLRPGTPLVVWGPNNPQLVATYFGAMMARLPLVPIDPFSTQDFLERIVEETGSPAVIAAFPIDAPIPSANTDVIVEPPQAMPPPAPVEPVEHGPLRLAHGDLPTRGHETGISLSAPTEPMTVKILTNDPNVVIYWIVDPKGEKENA